MTASSTRMMHDDCDFGEEVRHVNVVIPKMQVRSCKHCIVRGCHRRLYTQMVITSTDLPRSPTASPRLFRSAAVTRACDMSSISPIHVPMRIRAHCNCSVVWRAFDVRCICLPHHHDRPDRVVSGSLQVQAAFTHTASSFTWLVSFRP